jgi:hypothetical protein
MTTKARVKIIKKNQLKDSTESVRIEVSPKQTAQTAREMVSTVTGWVSDFQHRRREETKQAFEILFSAQPKPSEM